MDHQASKYPLISIITPSFNQGQFLPETIESVLSQEGDFTIDYIIVDGGSTDNSVAVIRQYEALLQQGEWPVKCRGINYCWVSEKDKGQTDALLKGFRLAKGELFAWLNSDDTYLQGALQTVAGFFRDNPDTGLLYGDASYCDTEGAIIGSYRTEEFEYDKLAWFNFICQPATFFRKEAFKAVGGLDESLHFAMDFDLWIRIGKRFPCSYLPGVLATYRLHETSKTIRAETLFANSEEALRLAIKYFHWAPLTRIYNSCSFYCSARLPSFLAKLRLFVIPATIICTVLRSARLNRGLSRNDLKLLNRENFRKISKSRLEIMTGSKHSATGSKNGAA